MNEPNSHQDGKNGNPPDDSLVVPCGIYHADQKQNTDTKDAPDKERCNPQNSPKKAYWRQLIDEKPDRHIELGLSLAIAFFALSQLITSCRNNDSTTRQTDQLISAAKISAYSASESLQASRNFADSARSINEGVRNAVTELNRQAEITEHARETSASFSQQSLQATIDNFHEDQRAWVGIAGNGHISTSIVDGSPLKVHIDFQNFGKTPAFNERGIAKILTHPNSVPLPSFDTYSLVEASAPITLMPGVSAGVTIETNTPSAEGNVIIMDKTMITSIDGGAMEVYLYGSQWYDDAFKKPHRTDFCLIYLPRTRGWGSCNRHNYAD
jgi:hypothetical protein